MPIRPATQHDATAIAAAKAGGAPVAGHHSPLFQVAPRESVVLGTRAMVAAVLDLAPAR